MGLDRIDILYLHDPDDHFEQASTEGIGALIELREQGVVRAVGAGMNQPRLLAELIRRADVDVVMCAGRFTLLDDEASRTCCRSRSSAASASSPPRSTTPAC